MATPAQVARVVKQKPRCRKYGYASEKFVGIALQKHIDEYGCDKIVIYRNCKCGFMHIGHISKVYGDACKERNRCM